MTDLVHIWREVVLGLGALHPIQFLRSDQPNWPNQPTGLKVKNLHNFGIFQPIWLKFGMESLNGRTQHMYVIYMHLSMLTGQTDLPPNQLTGLKVKNLHNFVIFQLIWLKLGMESLNGRTQHMQTFYLFKPPYHPTSLPA